MNPPKWKEVAGGNPRGYFLDEAAGVAGLMIDHIWAGSEMRTVAAAHKGDKRAVLSLMALESIQAEIAEGKGSCSHCRAKIGFWEDIGAVSAVHLPPGTVQENALTFGVPYCRECAGDPNVGTAKETLSDRTKAQIERLFQVPVVRKQ